MFLNEIQSTKRSIKGTVDIKVFDKNGKLKQHETGENMITNYYKDILASYFDPVWRTLLSTDKSPFLDINKTITKHSKGILLFGNKLIENADNYMFSRLWKWARWRHPNLGLRRIKRKYFRKYRNSKWRFSTHEGLILRLHGDTHIIRHKKIHGTRSPFDRDNKYWVKRNGKFEQYLRCI